MIKRLTILQRGFYDTATHDRVILLAKNATYPVVHVKPNGDYVCEVTRNAWGDSGYASVVIEKENGSLETQLG